MTISKEDEEIINYVLKKLMEDSKADQTATLLLMADIIKTMKNDRKE